jgi:hypothetical protein
MEKGGSLRWEECWIMVIRTMRVFMAHQMDSQFSNLTTGHSAVTIVE